MRCRPNQVLFEANCCFVLLDNLQCISFHYCTQRGCFLTRPLERCKKMKTKEFARSMAVQRKSSCQDFICHFKLADCHLQFSIRVIVDANPELKVQWEIFCVIQRSTCDVKVWIYLKTNVISLKYIRNRGSGENLPKKARFQEILMSKNKL